MDGNIKDFGKIIRCMAKELLYGLMAENTRASTLMRKRKAMVNSAGPTAVATKGSGGTVSKMARVYIEIKRESRDQVSGPMEGKLDGSSD